MKKICPAYKVILKQQEESRNGKQEERKNRKQERLIIGLEMDDINELS